MVLFMRSSENDFYFRSPGPLGIHGGHPTRRRHVGGGKVGRRRGDVCGEREGAHFFFFGAEIPSKIKSPILTQRFCYRGPKPQKCPNPEKRGILFLRSDLAL